MLLHRYGSSVSEGAMAYRAGTSLFGTDEYELADGMRSVLKAIGGTAAATHESVADVLVGELPCIVYIDTQFGCHAVVLDRVFEGACTIVDPLGGLRKTLSTTEFAEVFRGVVVRVQGVDLRRD